MQASEHEARALVTRLREKLLNADWANGLSLLWSAVYWLACLSVPADLLCVLFFRSAPDLLTGGLPLRQRQMHPPLLAVWRRQRLRGRLGRTGLSWVLFSSLLSNKHAIITPGQWELLTSTDVMQWWEVNAPMVSALWHLSWHHPGVLLICGAVCICVYTHVKISQ